MYSGLNICWVNVKWFQENYLDGSVGITWLNDCLKRSMLIVLITRLSRFNACSCLNYFSQKLSSSLNATHFLFDAFSFQWRFYSKLKLGPSSPPLTHTSHSQFLSIDALLYNWCSFIYPSTSPQAKTWPTSRSPLVKNLFFIFQDVNSSQSESYFKIDLIKHFHPPFLSLTLSRLIFQISGRNTWRWKYLCERWV